MGRFLRYAVELTLEGRAGELKEYSLGLEVFDRKSNYDPRVDPIVRVEARRLRSKLKAYYEGDGHDDPVIFEFSTGTYAPQIRMRSQRFDEIRPDANTVAVLPFTNLSPTGGYDYFTDGLTEELIHALTRIRGMRVVAWNSAARMRDVGEDLPEVRRRLRVAYVLTGSARIAGTSLRVRAQLIDTETGVYLWSETFDRQMEDVFQIQEEIARAIVGIHVKMTGGQESAMAMRNPTGVNSYDYYLKGRYHWHRRTPQDLSRSVSYFEAALDADPNSALAYAGVADAYVLLVDHGAIHPAEGIPKARAAAARAIQIDPNLAEAYPALAVIRSHCEGRWKEAESLYRKAIALNPGYATAHHWLGIDCLALMGRLDEGLAELDIAVQLDPLSSVLHEGRAYFSLLRRDYEDAIRQHREVLEFDPGFYRACTAIGRAYIQLGRYSEALEMLEKGRSLGGDVPHILGAIGQAFALSGDDRAARGVLAKLQLLAAQGYVPSSCFAVVHLGLGENEIALDWLERGCEQHEMTVSVLKVHPVYDCLRSEARFQAILKKLGLA
jgi:serine/threonine-protein kinase